MEPADGEHSANVLYPVSAIPASFWPAQGGAKITGPKTRRRMSISFSPDTSKGLGEIRLSCVYERAGEGSPPGGDKADLHYPKELGILHVNVVEARGLPKMDRFSHTDSFAKVQFKDEVGETFVAMDTEDPGWNQEFRFHVHKRNDLRGVMQCSVWDKDDSLRDQSDDVIGQCELELHEELLLGREDDVWMQLKAAPGSPKSVRPVTSTTQQRALTELSLSLSRTHPGSTDSEGRWGTSLTQPTLFALSGLRALTSFCAAALAGPDASESLVRAPPSVSQLRLFFTMLCAH